MAVRRAYGSAEKAARRQNILDAAERLYVADFAQGLPGIAQIADAAGLAKGTVYLYFDTKEEIFAALLLAKWNRVLDALGETLASSRSADDTVTAFLRRFVECLDASPLLMRLDALEGSVLGSRMTSKAVHDFKISFHVEMSRVSLALEAKLNLPPGRGLPLLTRTHALTRGLWQAMAAHETVSDSGIKAGATGRKPHTTFALEATEALAEYWYGALHR